MYYVSNNQKTQYGVQLTYDSGLVSLPDEFLPEFFKPGKKAAGFVILEHDGTTVTSCTWNEDAYQKYLANLPAPNPEKIREERSTAIKAACAEAITGGFDADVLGRGPLHYTLTEIQQRDLQTQYAAVQAGATEALWHDSSRVTHEVYTAAQFTALFQMGYAYIISCKIRSDWLEQLAHDLVDADKLTEAAAVDWATELPEDYRMQCDAQIAAMLGGGNA
ncbi:hypothetical protein [Oscillibacter sp.]|uniref:DUF4376 domain-containing protein n=1 Tax=Oscillibacter sp. TaxID=1945593 RepID=UPI0028B19A2F|nr:hypothetical protein [Oscillibacter sp.]